MDLKKGTYFMSSYHELQRKEDQQGKITHCTIELQHVAALVICTNQTCKTVTDKRKGDTWIRGHSITHSMAHKTRHANEQLICWGNGAVMPSGMLENPTLLSPGAGKSKTGWISFWMIYRSVFCLCLHPSPPTHKHLSPLYHLLHFTLSLYFHLISWYVSILPSGCAVNVSDVKFE